MSAARRLALLALFAEAHMADSGRKRATRVAEALEIWTFLTPQ